VGRGKVVQTLKHTDLKLPSQQRTEPLNDARIDGNPQNGERLMDTDVWELLVIIVRHLPIKIVVSVISRMDVQGMNGRYQ
jgi:hypothetical protein